MENLANQEQSIELLQQLGLKEYEAKSFVALSRLPQGTAKEISDISEVPRTRVYDSIRVLEQKGLVEIHHSNPKQFRTVSIDEAVNILKSEYVTRIESLRESLTDLEPAGTDEETEITHEVWA
ncbi:MAG: helix-turn-helix domain-containing protein, partial [Halovenus sp.]